MDFFTFDSASRGPWGSLMLMGTTKCRCVSHELFYSLKLCNVAHQLTFNARHLATVGAAITIFALAFETMFQQIVAYPERAVIVGDASIATSRNFHIPFRPDTLNRDAPTLNADPQLSNFIDTSIYATDNIFTPPPSTCPSGNCSWPEYSSLAVCNQCKDVTDLLYYQCKNYTEVNDITGVPLQRACGWLLNNTLMIGSSITPRTRRTYSYLIMHAVATPQDITINGDPHLNSTQFKDVAYPLLDLYVAYTPGGLDAVRRNETPKMVECLMSWCVQSYRAEHRDGVLNETVISTFMDPTRSRVSEADLQAGKQPVVISPPNGNGTFTVSNSTTEALRRKLMFSQGTAGGDLTPIANEGTDNDNITSLQGIYNFVMTPPYDISPGLDQIAASITNSMRRRTNGTETVTGAAWAPQTFVQIRWVWITLPAVLLIFSFIFLVGTILESARKNVAIWKTSALAVLLHGLSGDAQHKLDPETPASEVEAAAHNIRMIYSSEKETSRLVIV